MSSPDPMHKKESDHKVQKDSGHKLKQESAHKIKKESGHKLRIDSHTQVKGKKKDDHHRKPHIHSFPCEMVPANVPDPGTTQRIIHPRKDVFVLKVAKVGATGGRRCKMELELVTPKGPERRIPARVDTRETQCDPDPPPCSCCGSPRRKRK